MADTNVVQTEKKEIVIPEEVERGRKVLVDALTALYQNYGSVYEPGKSINKFVKQIKENSLGDFVSINKDLQVSYSKDKEDPFTANKRITTTLGRYVRRNLKIPNNILPDYYLDDISTYLSRELAMAKDEEVTLLAGKDIQKFYGSTKITSCMTGQKSKLTELYIINPDKINLAVYTVDGKVLARALFWHCDDGTKVLDRVYPDGSKNIYALINWAKSKGYQVKYEGIKKAYKVTVDVKTAAPYLDTFTFASTDIKNKKVILSNYRIGHGSYLGDLLNRYAYDKSRKSIKISPWEETERCNQCGCDYVKGVTEILPPPLGKSKNYKICPICEKQHIIKCAACEKRFWRINRRYNTKNNTAGNYCEDCAKKHLQTCSHCGYCFIKGNEKFYSVKKFGTATEYKFCNTCVKSYCYILKEEKTEAGKLTKENSTTTKKMVKKTTKKAKA